MTDRELMQQALEAMGTVGANWICEASHHAKKDQHKWGEPCPLQQRWHIAYQALRERLAQPEQKPVAWLVQYSNKHEFVWGQKPQWIADAIGIDPLYTTPPAAQWVGLTQEDIAEIAEKLGLADVAWVDLMQAIERRLKRRNT